MEDGLHSVVFHLGTNPGDPTCKNDIALGFFQGKILLIREAFRAVLRNYGSTAEDIRPLAMNGIFSIDGKILLPLTQYVSEF